MKNGFLTFLFGTPLVVAIGWLVLIGAREVGMGPWSVAPMLLAHFLTWVAVFSLLPE